MLNAKNKTMTKKTLFILFLTFSVFTYSQDKSYGLLLGANFYESNNNNGENQLIIKDNKFTTSNFGAYFEYGINENIGIKSELTFNKKMITYNKFDLDFELQFIEFSPSFKYDFGTEYKKGFYMTLGPRFSFLIKTESDENSEDTFENLNIGLQLGLGHRLTNFIDFQAKIDYGITPYFKLENNDKSKFFGAYLTLFIDASELIK